MKRLKIILFEDALEYKKYASSVCDKLSGESDESAFLGTWWIEYNEEEAYSAISGAANHFIDNTDKAEIIFGISNKDYDNIISKIHTENCIVETIFCKNV